MCPGVDNFGVFIEDQPTLARDVVRYVGEAVVAVAAETLDIARAALALIHVEYEELPSLFDPHEAMKDGAVQLHSFAQNNICKHTRIRKGDVDAALAQADIIVEQTYNTPIHRACLP
jgi:CO/xanthine dehydrogenase Mo-binding subunit